MIITTTLNETQLKMVNNLLMNVTTKQEMFDYLICKVGLNAYHSTLMSNSFNKVPSDSFSVLRGIK